MDLIRRQSLGRNDADYRLMLNICELLLRQTNTNRKRRSSFLTGLDREQIIAYKVFERFVANFYKLHLPGWKVKAQTQLAWHADTTSSYMPVMSADVVLHEIATGRRVVLDTKYTPRSLVTNQWALPFSIRPMFTRFTPT